MTISKRQACALPVVLVAIALAGCGGSGSSSSSSSASSSASTAAQTSSGNFTTSTGTPTNNGEASKPASQIIADTEAALGQIHSFHIAGTAVQSGQSNQITGDLQLPGRVSATLTAGSAVAHVVVINGKVYFNANQAYYLAQKTSTAVAQTLENRWVYFPAGQGPSIGSLAAAVDPTKIGKCLIAAHLGTVTVQGTGTVNGQPAVILFDHGDVPGSTPGRLYVATTGPSLPLKTVQTGLQKPGGTPNTACLEDASDVSGDTTASTALYTEYNTAPPVNAPAGAVALSSLGSS